MTKEEKAVAIEKKIECVIGCILLAPAIIGAFAFILCLFDCEWDWVRLRDLSSDWTMGYNEGGGMSAAPIYLGIMALAGCYMVKDCFHYFFLNEEKKKEKISINTTAKDA